MVPPAFARWRRRIVLGLAMATVAYPQTAPALVSPYEDKLIRAQGNDPVYLVRGGKKYWIRNPNWIADHGYTWQGVRVLDPSEVAAVPSGYDLELQTPVPPGFAGLEGALIQARGKPSIYFVRDGKRYRILNPDREDVRILETAVVEAIPAATELVFGAPVPGSQITSGLISATDGRVFLVQDGRRHYIADARWIAASRYAGQRAVRVSDAELQSIPIAADITYTPLWEKLLTGLIATALFAFFLLLRASARRGSLVENQPESNRGKGLTWTPQRTRLTLFFAFTAAVALREPYLILHPRFWAEEGTDFFVYAASHSVLRTLFFVHPVSSYLNLFPNIAAISAAITARRIGLEYAPAATTLASFFIQALAIGLITLGRSRLFNSPWKAAAGCLIVLFAPTTTDEIWLNSINSMTFFGLIALLLLFEETLAWPSHLKWLSRAALLVGGLTSLYTVALLPLFGLIAWRRRERERKIQVAILTVCLLIQIGTVLLGRMAHIQAWEVRGTEVRLETSLVNVFGWHILSPSLGSPLRGDVIDNIGLWEAWINATSFPPRPPTSSQPLAGWLCFLIIAGILWRLAGGAIDSPNNTLLSAFLILSVLTCVGSIHSVPFNRYAFLPGATFLLLLFVNAELSKSPVVSYVCIIVLSFSLATGMVHYRRPSIMAPDASWSSEVKVWRKDPSHVIRIWPSGWTANIPGNLVQGGLR